MLKQISNLGAILRGFVNTGPGVFHCHAPGKNLLEHIPAMISCDVLTCSIHDIQQRHLILWSTIIYFSPPCWKNWSCHLWSYTFHLHAEKTDLVVYDHILSTSMLKKLILSSMIINFPPPCWKKPLLLDLEMESMVEGTPLLSFHVAANLSHDN